MNIRSILFSAVSLSALLPQVAKADQGGNAGAGDIIVTASPLGQRADETATPVLTITDDELVHRRQATLGETLAGQPGINFDNFGGGAGRPVIRGQTAPRVQTLADSSNLQDASTISPDHAVTTEPLLLRGIEVLRGPAALIYGGGAIGGAINLLDEKVPTSLPNGGITAAVEGRLGTADDERTAVGGVTVAVGPIALRAEGVYRNTSDYRVPSAFGEDRVDGSFNDTNTVSLGASWVGDGGYLGVAYTRQRSEYGLPGHEHDYESCHPHGTSLHCGSHGEEEEDGHDHEHGHEHDEVPIVKLRSNRFDIRSEYRDPLPGFEKVRFRMSFTDYEHDEIEEGEVSTTFKNKAHDIRFELTHKPVAGLRGVLGVQHSESDFSALGEEAFLPRSETRNTALYLMETLQAGPVRFELAGRQEWQSIETTLNRRAEHNPFSFSGAAVWSIKDDYSLALSLARSQRAPNAQELYARGVHLATNTFELGSATLGKETSRSVDLTFRKTDGATTFTIGAYHQDFDNYIYASTLDRFEDFRLIRYSGVDATFSGVEGEVRHQFAPYFAAAVFGDYVRAKIKDDGGNLPRIPAGRLGGRLDGDFGPLSADIEYFHVFNQDKVADFETRTPSYNMVNATMAYHLDLGAEKRAEVFLRGTNLTNELAFNHASFIKNASPLRGRNVVLGVRAGF
ncbi:TonB-dependent receptor domain-containing protein [Novosphingobium sp. M1R2S20]|uniref:TonB-dependent receptor n=1 Tax=Novosphingobium rhizovicinum TaxID=3228928 RepID=A0ABV3RBA8_9SPHN